MGQVRRLSPTDFEWFSKLLLESLDYRDVRVTEKKGEKRGDGGIDLTGTFDGVRFYGECKRWKRGLDGTDILPIAVVRTLGGVMARDKVRRGVVVTTLRADHNCISEGGRMGIGVLGAPEIAAAMKKVNPSFRGDEGPGFGVRLLRLLLSPLRFLTGGESD